MSRRQRERKPVVRVHRAHSKARTSQSLVYVVIQRSNALQESTAHEIQRRKLRENRYGVRIREDKGNTNSAS